MQGRIYVAEDRTSESDQPANEQYNERLRYTCPHTDDAAVPADQGRVSGHASVLSDGRLLRAVFR